MDLVLSGVLTLVPLLAATQYPGYFASSHSTAGATGCLAILAVQNGNHIQQAQAASPSTPRLANDAEAARSN